MENMIDENDVRTNFPFRHWLFLRLDHYLGTNLYRRLIEKQKKINLEE